MSLPIGLQNNNPGNIRVSDWTRAQAGFEGQAHGFAVFQTPAHGVHAMARLLLGYRVNHNLKNVTEIIHRWAPPNENSTHAYVDFVAKTMGISPTLTLDLDHADTMAELINAMIWMECGQQPFRWSALIEWQTL